MPRREEDSVSDEDLGVLHSGKIFWVSSPHREKYVAERERQHSEFEERDVGIVLRAEKNPA
jgi:hypothetical protein